MSSLGYAHAWLRSRAARAASDILLGCVLAIAGSVAIANAQVEPACPARPDGPLGVSNGCRLRARGGRGRSVLPRLLRSIGRAGAMERRRVAGDRARHPGRSRRNEGMGWSTPAAVRAVRVCRVVCPGAGHRHCHRARLSTAQHRRRLAWPAAWYGRDRHCIGQRALHVRHWPAGRRHLSAGCCVGVDRRGRRPDRFLFAVAADCHLRAPGCRPGQPSHSGVCRGGLASAGDGRHCGLRLRRLLAQQFAVGRLCCCSCSPCSA